MSDEHDIPIREFTRSPVHMTVYLRTEDGTEIHGTTREISMNGLFIECADKLPVDTPCHITLTLGDGEHLIEADAEVKGIISSGMGLAFTGIEAESWEHLKRLNLFNAEDPDQVEAELNRHLGFKTRIKP